MQIQAIVHKAEEGGYWAEVPALPGCVSQGETIEEVTTNIREAIQGCLDRTL
jgi:predicted RNase H-like HicB family nuclease